MREDGIINLLKPAGMTSHDAVSFLRRLTGIKRIGHTGTLDPMAVGVLPLCIGSAARITEYLDLDFKKYRCEVQLGFETDTLDIWGQVNECEKLDITSIRSKNIDLQTVLNVLESFRGEISQYPPKYSAIRVDGKRLYEYAREGKEVEIKPRDVFIKEINLVRYDQEKCTILFDVVCSKGTYIRSICSEIGQALGTGGSMSFLIRTASGEFSLENTVTVETLASYKKTDEPIPLEILNEFLFSIDYPLVHFGSVIVNQGRDLWFINGGHLAMEEVTVNKESNYKEFYKIYSKDNRFLGVAAFNNQYNKLVADKVFARNV